MATYTPNNNLKKPDGSDYVLVADFNRNSDIIDSDLGNLTQLVTPTKTNLVGAINEASQMGGGHSPYFDAGTGTWWEWDATTLQYVDTGERSSAPVVVQSTTTLAPNEDATVENAGTPNDVKLIFGIPKGETGTAATIAAGTTTTASPTTPASVHNSGTPQAAVFDFVIPRGETGAGMQILDRYDTLDALKAAHPTGVAGNAYEVGTTMPYDVYRWSDNLNDWYNAGPISGGGGSVKSWNKIEPDETGDIEVDSGNLPFDSSAATPVSTKETISGKLDSGAQAADSAKLGGQLPSYYATPRQEYPSTLIAANWAQGAEDFTQTLTITGILADANVRHTPYAAAADFGAYGDCGIYASDVTVAGQITFIAKKQPSADIAVNILQEAVTNG